MNNKKLMKLFLIIMSLFLILPATSAFAKSMDSENDIAAKKIKSEYTTNKKKKEVSKSDKKENKSNTEYKQKDGKKQTDNKKDEANENSIEENIIGHDAALFGALILLIIFIDCIFLIYKVREFENRKDDDV